MQGGAPRPHRGGRLNTPHVPEAKHQLARAEYHTAEAERALNRGLGEPLRSGVCVAQAGVQHVLQHVERFQGMRRGGEGAAAG